MAPKLNRSKLINVRRGLILSFRQVAIRNLKFTISDPFAGVLAQLVERLNGIEEVRGSNPLGSTPF